MSKKTLKFNHNGNKFQKIVKPDDFLAVVEIVQRRAKLSLPNDCYLVIGDDIIIDKNTFQAAIANQSERRVNVIVKVRNVLARNRFPLTVIITNSISKVKLKYTYTHL